MRSQKRRVSFANRIIAVCVAVSLGVTAAVVYEYHRLDTVLPAGVVTALLGLWGGELLIIALRQIFGSDIGGARDARALVDGGAGNDASTRGRYDAPSGADQDQPSI